MKFIKIELLIAWNLNFQASKLVHKFAKNCLALEHCNQTHVNELFSPEEDAGGLGIELDLADPATLEWEQRLIDILLRANNPTNPTSLSVLVNVARR